MHKTLHGGLLSQPGEILSNMETAGVALGKPWRNH